MQINMPLFVVVKHGVEMGTVSGVSYKQALGRARAIYGRCEVIATGNVAVGLPARKGDVAEARTMGRRPCPTPGFEERRAALIAAHKAAALA